MQDDSVVEVNKSDLTILFLAVGVLIISVVLNVVTLVFLSHQATATARVAAATQREAAATARQASTAAETHKAACAFRSNLVQQVQSSEKYLALHPEGVAALHLSAAYIRSQITREQSSVTSLTDLHCP